MSYDRIAVPSTAKRAHERTIWQLLAAVRAYRARAAGALFLVRALFQHSLAVDDIEVIGPQDFCERVAGALRLLRAEAPEAFDLCQRHFNLVVRSRQSGVNANARPAVVLLGPSEASVSTAYLASNLAHEAQHCNLYWSHRDREPTREVPSEVFSGEEAELRCVEYQITVLKQLGETNDVIERLRESMKTRWWNVPWHERNW